MRILTLSNYYPPHFIGGYEIACKETMDFLKEKGHEVVILTSDYHITHDSKEDNVLRDLHLINYSKTSRIQKTIDEYKNYKILLNIIEEIKPDLVYFWSLRGIGLHIIKAVEEKNIPKVFEIGDFWMYGYMQKESKFKQTVTSFFPFLNHKNIKISPAICVSQWVAKEMKELYNSEKTYFYPNATSIPKKEIFKDNKNVKFIFAGRIDDEKGLHLAIEALNKFALKHPHKAFSFDIFGDGEKTYIDKCKIISTPIASKIHFRGRVQSREEIYQDASILLMPTKMREPFGLVVIEAMAYKCAVIATNAYGPSEIIDHGENSLLFDISDPDDLLVQIEKLYLNTKYLHELQENAYKHVLQNYSISKVKSEVEILLKSIAGVSL